MIYILRVTLSKEEDKQDKEIVFREVKAKSTHSLMDLHKCLKRAFSLSGNEMSSFYYVDENWNQLKGEKEIALENMTGEEDFLTMVDVNIGEALPDKDSKLLYTYDFLLMHTFYIEVISIEEKKFIMANPLTIKVQGKMPNNKTLHDLKIQDINNEVNSSYSLLDSYDNKEGDFDEEKEDVFDDQSNYDEDQEDDFDEEKEDYDYGQEDR